MKVKEVMMGTPYTCPEDANLGTATELMWKANCGFLPVTRPDGKVCAVITDRDICVALGTRDRVAGEVFVNEAASRKLYAFARRRNPRCAPNHARRESAPAAGR